MGLLPGTRLGPYEITAVIGAGGMGEVYRARDTRLDRAVAIKVLPELFANDPDRLVRFEREAKTLASLNHPNIAQIHGLEEGRALVMELVEGEDLAERLTRGPVQIDEALAIARQLTDALEAAHEIGIVHRDLKPANIKVRTDGTVKVLDFGLAKALEAPAQPGGALDSPTFTSPAMTQLGVILGTAAYMSPEQARGRAANRRSDVWAFGCVLYEMLTGKRPFSGDDISMTIAAVLKESVDFAALPANTPQSVRRLLRRCLEKDPRRRLSSIADARLELDEQHESAVISAAPSISAWRTRLIWAAGGALVAAIVAAVVVGSRWRSTAAQPIVRSELSLPATPLLLSETRALALSPDGMTLVFAGGPPAAASQLYRRPLAEETVTPIQGTEGGSSPFFSTDGQWIVFKQNNRLRKIPAGGGTPVDYGDAIGHQGGSFAADGTIIFNRQHGEGLLRIRPGSTTAEVLTTVNRAAGESGHHWPHVLPDGRHALYTLEIDGKPYSEARIMLLALDSGQSRLLIDGGSDAQYVSTGHIVYWRLGDLWAAPFDIGSLQLTGSPAVVLKNVMFGEANGYAHFAAADNGTIAYLSGPDAGADRGFVLVDRTGAARPLTTDRKAYENAMISPDGSRIALTVVAANDSLWTLELDRGLMTRITFEGESAMPVWSPDGRRLIYARHMGGELRRLYSVPADGGAPPELLHASDRHEVPASSSAVGNLLAFTRIDDVTGSDVWVMSLEGERKARPWLATRFQETQPQVSPNGRWIAYVSDESGRAQVYVRSYPDGANKRQVSLEGGVEPRWRRDGRELFYRRDEAVLSTQLTEAGAVLSFSVPAVLFKARTDYLIASPARTWDSWDVMPDGQHFVFIQDFSKPHSTVLLVQNWFAELKSKFKR